MVDLPRFDPLPGFNFLITLIDTSSTFSTLSSAALGLALGGFSECKGLESRLETVDYLEGGVNDRVHRFPTRHAFANIELVHGVGFGEELLNWHNEFLEGKGTRRDGLIILQNEMKLPIKTWSFTRGLPVKWTGPTLNAQDSALAIESLEIAHEKLELLVSPGKLVADLSPF